MIAVLKGFKKKHKDKAQGKILYKSPFRINHKATKSKNNTGTFERSVV